MKIYIGKGEFMENIIKVWQNNHNITLYFMPHQTYVLKILRRFSLVCSLVYLVEY